MLQEEHRILLEDQNDKEKELKLTKNKMEQMTIQWNQIKSQMEKVS